MKACRNADTARLGQSFETRSDIHRLTKEIAVYHHCVAKVQAERNASAVLQKFFIGIFELILNLDSTT